MTDSFSDLSAQTVWYGRERVNSVSLEISKPVTPDVIVQGDLIPGLDAGSGSIFLGGRYSLKKNKNITFVADIPIAHGNIDDTTLVNGSETIIGNPYIGAEFDLPKLPVYFQLGLRIPAAPENNAVAKAAGIASDFDRAEAFLHDFFPLYGAVNYETVSDNKILFAARTGLKVWFNNNDTLNFDTDPAVIVDYDVQTGLIDKNINIILSAVGRYDLSSGPKYPKKRNSLQYGLSIVVPYKSIRPALSFRVPGNDNTSGLLNYVIGLDFKYVFK